MCGLGSDELRRLSFSGQWGLSFSVSNLLHWSVGPLCKMQRGSHMKRKPDSSSPQCPGISCCCLQTVLLWLVHVVQHRERPDKRFLVSSLKRLGWQHINRSWEEQWRLTVVKNMRYCDDEVTKHHSVKSTYTNKKLRRIKTKVIHHSPAFKALFTCILHSPWESTAQCGQKVQPTSETETHWPLSLWSLLTSKGKFQVSADPWEEGEEGVARQGQALKVLPSLTS